MIRNRHSLACFVLAVSLAAGACGSSNKAEEDDGIEIDNKPKVTTTQEDDYLVQHFDLDGEGEYDVVKYIETYEDPENPGVTKRRIRKKKVDLNTDGTFDVLREYDKEGVIQRERVDNDLDGTPDVINHFENGSLKRKEVLADDGETVVAVRIYSGDEVSKVEKDTNGDGKMDQFEYYQNEKIQRIGTDNNADGKIDKWVHK